MGNTLNKIKNKGLVVAPLNKRPKVDDLDHIMTAQEIRKRKAKARGKRIIWEALKAKHGLSRLKS